MVCQAVSDTGAETLAGFVPNVVNKEKLDSLATDEKQDYKYVQAGMPHDAVRHGASEYVRGTADTNNIESFLEPLEGRRATIISLYLNEFSFRFNQRKKPDIFREVSGRCSLTDLHGTRLKR